MHALALVCSPAEAMNCGFILRKLASDQPIEATLVLYGKAMSMPARLRAETIQTAAIFFQWSRIIDFCENSDRIVATRSDVRTATDLVLSELGLRKVDLILTHTMHMLPERAILASAPDASIVLFDNGVSSHVERQISATDAAWREVNTINAKDLARVQRAYFMLGDVLPIPTPISSRPCITIDAAEYRAYLASLLEKARPSLWTREVPRGPCHLMLGTSFYRTSHITLAEEQRLYQEKADSILATSEMTVLFKEHPRANAGRLLSEGDRIVLIDSTLPVEFLPLICDVRGASSLGSTALLTLRKLFGVPPEFLGRGTGPTAIAHVRQLMEALQAPGA